MPLGIQRLNAKRSQPNERIIFIKPLKGPDEEVARDYLERIAAQCLPIMRSHHLSVTSLEEYEPNPEFVGRNFNAGEVIQLVLKSRSGSSWLPFGYVQMVMMHELAHCRQMNHSRAFWAVRNRYADEMRALWASKYTGEGIWGRGAMLGTGEWEKKNAVGEGEPLPEHLCGGTYRSRTKKRRAKQQEKLSYREQKERRILKKFGRNGVALGGDEETKKKLEGGKQVKGKPRVAGSLRGRELRAAAALARFDQKKEEEEEEKEVVKEEGEEGSETDSGDDYEGDEDEGEEGAAIDIDGKRMVDGQGRGMVKVCEDENVCEDQDAQQELRELLGFGTRNPPNFKEDVEDGVEKGPPAVSAKTAPERRQDDRSAEQKITISKPKPPPSSSTDDSHVYISSKPVDKRPAKPKNEKQQSLDSSLVYQSAVPTTCPICSFANEELSATCAMCSNVLDSRRVPGSWSCTSQTCKGSKYRNAGDSGVCGVCGQRKRLTAA